MKKKILILSFILLLLDVIIKLVVNNYLLNEIIIIKNFFSLEKVYNNGAAFSILSGNKYFLIIISIVIFIFLLYYMLSFKKNTRNTIAFSLIYAGLLGNLIDRIVYSHVIDYFKFKIFSYNAPIFNLADTMIFFGIILIGYAVIKKEDVNETNSRD